MTHGREFMLEKPMLKKKDFSYKRNITGRSRNHCCYEKAIIITYSECVSVAYPVRKAH